MMMGTRTTSIGRRRMMGMISEEVDNDEGDEDDLDWESDDDDDDGDEDDLDWEAEDDGDDVGKDPEWEPEEDGGNDDVPSSEEVDNDEGDEDDLDWESDDDDDDGDEDDLDWEAEDDGDDVGKDPEWEPEEDSGNDDVPSGCELLSVGSLLVDDSELLLVLRELDVVVVVVEVSTGGSEDDDSSVSVAVAPVWSGPVVTVSLDSSRLARRGMEAARPGSTRWMASSPHSNKATPVRWTQVILAEEDGRCCLSGVESTVVAACFSETGRGV
ncbi:hypothetical protein VTJ49DRAFT_7121 [Mycothermus thermophilus]|uniref:Uncharacterized protein n=1 Tax=Humicola insolens TaxID=85995 RepID=A0ABR3VHX7_HUMIN